MVSMSKHPPAALSLLLVGIGLLLLSLPANAGSSSHTVACGGGVIFQGSPVAVGIIADGTLAMQGEASPNPAASGAGLTLSDAVLQLELPRELALFAYENSNLIPVNNGSNSWSGTLDSRITPANASPGMNFHQAAITLDFTINDPGPGGGAVKATVDPIVVALPQSAWTAGGADVEFSHGSAELLFDFVTYQVVVACEAGVATPDGQSFTPEPPSVFEVVYLPSSATTSYSCQEDVEFNDFWTMDMTLEGVALPEPAVLDSPVDLTLVGLSSSLSADLLLDLFLAGYLDPGVNAVIVRVDQDVEASGTTASPQLLSAETTTQLFVDPPSQDPVTGGDWQAALPASVWMPALPGPLEFRQGDLDLELVLPQGTLNFVCTPDTPPAQPFESLVLAPPAPALPWSAHVLVALAMLLLGARSLRGRVA